MLGNLTDDLIWKKKKTYTLLGVVMLILPGMFLSILVLTFVIKLAFLFCFLSLLRL